MVRILKDLPVRLILLKDSSHYYDLALITIHPTITPAQAVENYAALWGIELTFQTVRSHLGAGQARNCTAQAVQRTIPFTLTVYTLTWIWYILHGDPVTDLAARHAREPWYTTTKTSFAYTDVQTALKHALTSTNEYPPPAPKPITSSKSRHPDIPHSSSSMRNINRFHGPSKVEDVGWLTKFVSIQFFPRKSMQGWADWIELHAPESFHSSGEA